MAYSNRECFFFGTEERAGFIRTPLRGASANPEAWGSGGTLLNGGGYQYNSWGSHKTYQFEWGSSTPYPVAQKMKSYFDGSYGRGLIYFYDPHIFQYNILPAQWADPSIALNSEGSSLVYGVEPTALDFQIDTETNQYPLIRTRYGLDNVPAGWRGREDSVYLPIPEGYTLALGAAGNAVGTGAVMYRTSNRGVLGAAVNVLEFLPNTGPVVNTHIAHSETVSGVWLFIGKSASGIGRVALAGMTARLVKTSLVEGVFSLGYGLDPYGTWPYGSYSPYSEILSAGPWTGGMGHSGTRFMGPPTFELTGPGMQKQGQAGFAASFREVGSFAYA